MTACLSHSAGPDMSLKHTYVRKPVSAPQMALSQVDKNPACSNPSHETPDDGPFTG